jgi:hypothetical protein
MMPCARCGHSKATHNRIGGCGAVTERKNGKITEICPCEEFMEQPRLLTCPR